jgi:hypothetical protein
VSGIKYATVIKEEKNYWMWYFLCGLWVFDAARTSLLSPCLARAVSSKSTTTAFMCHVILHSKVVDCGVLYAVQIVSNTQYVVKGRR